MISHWQTLVALLVVALAALFLLHSAWPRGGRADCGGCGPDRFKRQLRRAAPGRLMK